jgi:SNF2 family DNA or RNA helicase
MSAVMVLMALAQNPQWPTLVVAPGTLVVKNWKQEAMKFVGSEGTQIVACPSTKALQEFIKDPGSSVEDMHILIITYNALPQAWVHIPFFALVLLSCS